MRRHIALMAHSYWPEKIRRIRLWGNTLLESTFPGIIAFAVLCSLMMLGTVLRAKIGFLQRNFVPASITGGVVGSIGFAVFSETLDWSYDYTAFTFHFFTLSFMSLCLTANPQSEARARAVTMGGMWLSLVWVACLVMQALLGFGVVSVFNLFSHDPISAYIGALSTHGFTQGPGQALAFGTIWENEFAVREAANIGIIYASLGFITAFLVGVPFARWAIARGLNVNKTAAIKPDFLRGLFSEDAGRAEGRQITHPSNLDNLAYHVCLLGMAYLITHIWLAAMQGVISGIPDRPSLIDILFSHNLFFVHGLIICLLMRSLLVRLGLGHYLDSTTQKRITGSAVDFMVISALLSVKLAILADFMVPIFAVAFTVATATALLCYFLGKHLKDLGIERTLAIFGCCTGSTGSGLLLLRLVDPDYRTTVPQELAFFNVAILFLSLHILLFFAPTLPSVSLPVFLALYGGTFVICVGTLVALKSKWSDSSASRS